MPEPKILTRGKRFQEIVQNHFKAKVKNLSVFEEKNVSFEKMKSITSIRGRIDILIIEEGNDFLVIYEIKATDWDKIKIQNIKRNIYRHQKQIFKYIDTYSEIFDLWANLALLYPQPPKDKLKKKLIEEYSPNKYGVPVYWFSEIDPTFDSSILD